jgi:inorganic pyrophosphatase
LPDHRLAELQRFFQDYKVLEGKEVDVGDFSDPEEAKDAVRHAIRLYDECFGHAPGTKAEGAGRRV